jgi:hypothetical protein
VRGPTLLEAWKKKARFALAFLAVRLMRAWFSA